MANLEQLLRASLISGENSPPLPANDSGARLYFRGQCDYDKLPGVGTGLIKELRQQSPKHYKHRLTNQREETRALGLGIDTHVATLEPERFVTDYAVWNTEHPDGRKRPRNGKEWEAFEAANSGKRIILDTERDAALELASAIRADPCAMKYLATGKPEVAMTWIDEETGMHCRTRLDWLNMIGLQLYFVELKSARNAGPFWFTRHAAKLDYHVQIAYCFDGLEAITGREPNPIILAVEPFAPYDVVTYRVPEEVIDVGRDAYRDALVLLKTCSQRDEWLGKGGGVEQVFSLPPWAVPDDNDDMSNLDWSKP